MVFFFDMDPLQTPPPKFDIWQTFFFFFFEGFEVYLNPDMVYLILRSLVLEKL